MKTRMTIMSLFAVVAYLPESALAGDDAGSHNDGMRPSYESCLRHSEGITSSLLDCNGKEQDYQDKRLNASYRKLLKSLSHDKGQSLKAAERAWIKERDTTCAEPSDSGTAGDIDYSNCFLNETAKQANKLENMSR